jgi:CHAD domain-containing protein
MEVALDQGEIVAGAAVMPICEIELELKSGPADGLFAAALVLLETVPLRIDSRSKAALGYQLAGAVKMKPRKATWPDLDPHAPANASWAALLEAALAQLVDNLPGFLERPQDSEYLHQLRIALRRLLGMARLIGSPAWMPALRRIMDVLNPARDWDVFREETLPRLHLPDDADYLAAVEMQALTARQAAQALLGDSEFTRGILDIGRHLLALRADAVPAPVKTTRHWAAQVLEQRWQAVQRRSRKLDRPDRRHRLRIAIKKLRYAADALAGLYGRNGNKALRRLQALQDDLGAANDLAVAERLMHDLTRTHPEAAFTAGRVVGRLCAAQDTPRAIRADLAKLKPFWR